MRNSAQYGGGGLFCQDSSTDLAECIFFGNVAPLWLGGGIMCNEGGSVMLTNCILSGNLSPQGGGIACYENSSAVLENTIIAFSPDGNFSACPSFCSADMGDFHLCDESPCLPGNHPDGYDCGLIGAWDVGCSCGPTVAEPATWSTIKSIYR